MGGRNQNGRRATSRYVIHLLATTLGVTEGFGALRPDFVPVRGKFPLHATGDKGESHRALGPVSSSARTTARGSTAASSSEKRVVRLTLIRWDEKAELVQNTHEIDGARSSL